MRKLLPLGLVPLCVAIEKDQRSFPEPVIPHACASLAAGLASEKGKLREEDERKLDTARIQQALDSCPAGRAVELKPGPGNAFLSGPLDLRRGVTLLVDAG